MNHRTIALVFAGLALGACHTPDGSETNRAGRPTAPLTPMDQKENSVDLATTATIRREILKVPDLSMTADNVKVITVDGKVTLRGMVKNETERDAIDKIAERVAGTGQVDNQLEIDTHQM